MNSPISRITSTPHLSRDHALRNSTLRVTLGPELNLHFNLATSQSNFTNTFTGPEPPYYDGFGPSTGIVEEFNWFGLLFLFLSLLKMSLYHLHHLFSPEYFDRDLFHFLLLLYVYQSVINRRKTLSLTHALSSTKSSTVYGSRASYRAQKKHFILSKRIRYLSKPALNNSLNRQYIWEIENGT